MNKTTKGAIAGAAGIVLLLGGAGTFALWNDSTSFDGGTITSGTLSIDDSATGAWKDVSSDGPVGGTAIADIDAFRVVPGDTLAYTQNITIHATGDNLLATFGYSLSGGDVAAPVSATVTVKDSLGATVPTSTVLDQDDDGAVYTVTVTFDFPSTIGDGVGNGQQLQATEFDLGSVAVTLQQNTRS